MAQNGPTFTMLRISRMMVADPAEKICAYDIRKRLKLDQNIVWNSLLNMQQAGWLTSEVERKSNSGSGRIRRLYRITDLGLSLAYAALSELQLPGVVPLSS